MLFRSLWENHRQDGQVEVQIVDDLANPSAVNYSIIQGGWTGLGEHNLAEDPLFAEPEIGRASCRERV